MSCADTGVLQPVTTQPLHCPRYHVSLRHPAQLTCTRRILGGSTFGRGQSTRALSTLTLTVWCCATSRHCLCCPLVSRQLWVCPSPCTKTCRHLLCPSPLYEPSQLLSVCYTCATYETDRSRLTFLSVLHASLEHTFVAWPQPGILRREGSTV